MIQSLVILKNVCSCLNHFFISLYRHVYIYIEITHIIISATSFLKGGTGIDYINNKKKFDSTPAVLLDQFATFDDNKNNNRELAKNMLKERQKIAKSNLESDINNFAKTIDHAPYKTGNFTKIVHAINIHLLLEGILFLSLIL